MPVLFLSGGKDSCGVAASLYIQGLKFTAYTYDNGFISKQAWKNIKNVIDVTSSDHFIFKKEVLWYESFIDSDLKNMGMCEVCTCFQADYYYAGYHIANLFDGIVITGSDGKDDHIYPENIKRVTEFALKNGLSLGEMTKPDVKIIPYWVHNKQHLPTVMSNIKKLFQWESNEAGSTSTCTCCGLAKG